MNPAIVVSSWLAGRSKTYVDACHTTLADFCEFLKESDPSFPGTDLIEVPVFAYICTVKPAQIRMFHEWLKTRVSKRDRKPLSESYITAKIRQLGSFYKFLEMNDYIQVTPVRKAGIRLKEPRPVAAQPAISEEQVTKFFRGINIRYQDGIRDYAIMALMFGAALRVGEVEKLRVGDVRFLEGGIVAVMLWHTKSGENRLHSVAPWVAGALCAWLDVRRKMNAGPDESLFGITDGMIRRQFKWYATKIGMPHISTHAARKTAITKLIRAGVPHRQVQEFSRHSSIQMVERYDDSVGRPERNPGLFLQYEGVNPRQFRLVDELVPVESNQGDEDVH